MKTMKLGNTQPVRVKEADVNSFEKKGYKYCSRSEWKEKVRDADKVEKEEKKAEKEAVKAEKKEKKAKKSA